MKILENVKRGGSCPHCGQPINPNVKHRRLFSLILVLPALGIFLPRIFSNSLVDSDIFKFTCLGLVVLFVIVLIFTEQYEKKNT